MELDIDKLQRSIKACAHHPEHDCRKCEYSNDKLWCYNDKLLSDFDKIIDMLKEQEAVEPVHKNAGDFCGRCDSYIRWSDKYCPECGAKILRKGE